MKLPFFAGPIEFVLEPLSADDASQLPDLHAEDFQRPWAEHEFASLLDQPPVFGFAAWRVGNRKAGPAGFVLARLAAGEGEILTIAVARAYRRLGLGRDLMEAVLRELHAERAEALFLEVDENNRAAIALYRRLGFREVARRPAYYAHEDGPKSAALVMRRDLR
ncbi:ribosomal-protein-alanine N-acetyltransferase [Mesorhizobium microcysteis]|uniref:Ribosomal-protein-alanine N-acetyltransferase n=1 Tax=Neoaquamicrobium microcysteis TaxID=2682781 RepID=A0A5D4GT51_9HYPH|nr:ribosomal protein S18-alanine N-acetyltransferase [Mesorhizobium microcysteis]TYR29740.1 ribosomal-protein-alanine N-acetyltransferase [Mesorhizobium microcysteis]